MKEFETTDVANAGVTLTIEGPESPLWQRQAELVIRIANNRRFQRAVAQVIKFVRSEDVRKAILSMEDVHKAEKKFENEPLLDAGVKQAAYLIVVNELNAADQSK